MRKAIITGASSGLGKEIGNLLAKNKCKVVNLSRSKSDFEDIKVDLSVDKEITNAIELIKKKHPNFDVLVLNAGIMPLAEIGKITFDIDKAFKVNILSMIKIVNGVFDLIKKNKADIVIIGSTAAFKPNQDHSVYTSTKFAVDGFIKMLQFELKNHESRVFGIHPGGFNSNLRGKGVVKEGFMDAKDIAKLIYTFLELPRNIEVSEIIINRKTIKNTKS